ncbi:MAG: glycosyltransferase family 2 protein [Bacteroides sp.]|nr:glycosyltransferase family 2 protein [Bacteroides sp.]
MDKLHVITPVKDSIDLTLQTAKAILDSKAGVPFIYTIYNDFSTEENTRKLEKASAEMGFELINLADLTSHPSPNYLLVLQTAQERALTEDAGLLIVESDVVVKEDTIQTLYGTAIRQLSAGMIAAVTVDENGEINFPYLYAKKREPGIYDEKKRLSFCCTLLTLNYLRTFDFHLLNPEKNWFDVTISHESLNKGFRNYLLTNLPVWHRPHGSRPWKQLKYKNPLKYYWLKYTKGLDKI